MKNSAIASWCSVVGLVLLSVARGNAYSLIPSLPGGRLTMNLDMGAAPMTFINNFVATWNDAPSAAMALWNQTGIGPGLDHSFFSVRSPQITGDPCQADGINEVRWAADYCGAAFGTALAITTTRTSAGVVVEKEIVFDSTRAWNAYNGPLRPSTGGATLNDIYRVALHEMGHAAGLSHPDDAGQTVAAIMNRAESDIYTLQPDDINGAHAISWGTVAGSPTSDVVEYYYDAWNFYFITSLQSEITALDGGAFGGVWRRTGQVFKAWTQSTASNSPTCRFFSIAFTPKSAHFYTPFAPECAGLMQGSAWQYEGVAFYVQLPLGVGTGNGSCPSGTTALYRQYNNGMGGAPNHRYTTSLTTFDQMAAAGWIFEGEANTKVFACVPQ